MYYPPIYLNVTLPEIGSIAYLFVFFLLENLVKWWPTKKTTRTNETKNSAFVYTRYERRNVLGSFYTYNTRKTYYLPFGICLLEWNIYVCSVITYNAVMISTAKPTLLAGMHLSAECLTAFGASAKTHTESDRQHNRNVASSKVVLDLIELGVCEYGLHAPTHIMPGGDDLLNCSPLPKYLRRANRQRWLTQRIKLNLPHVEHHMFHIDCRIDLDMCELCKWKISFSLPMRVHVSEPVFL